MSFHHPKWFGGFPKGSFGRLPNTVRYSCEDIPKKGYHEQNVLPLQKQVTEMDRMTLLMDKPKKSRMSEQMVFLPTSIEIIRH